MNKIEQKIVKDVVEMIKEARAISQRTAIDVECSLAVRLVYDHRWDVLNDVIEDDKFEALEDLANNEIEASTLDDIEISAEGGWIKWNPASRPIAYDEMVEVRLKNGEVHKGVAGEWYWGEDKRGTIVAYRIVEQEPTAEPKKCTCETDSEMFSCIADCDHEPEPKKVYKLSEMWKVWQKYPNGIKCTPTCYSSFEDAKEYTHRLGNVIAITPADATEFYEGQGMED